MDCRGTTKRARRGEREIEGERGREIGRKREPAIERKNKISISPFRKGNNEKKNAGQKIHEQTEPR